MDKLSVNAITVRMGSNMVLRDASASLIRGEVVAVLGPNGAGKSTLLKAIMGEVLYELGGITLDGASMATLSAQQRARKIAYLPQSRPLAWPICVQDVVALGRFAYGANIAKLSAIDAVAVDQAMTDCDIMRYAHRYTDSLSGGEAARVHCARSFAAQTPLLLADEPCTSLDPRYQLIIMSLFKKYAQRGGGAMIVLHDIELAARYADRIILLKEGRVVATGTPRTVLTPENLRIVYGVQAHISFENDAVRVNISSAL